MGVISRVPAYSLVFTALDMPLYWQAAQRIPDLASILDEKRAEEPPSHAGQLVQQRLEAPSKPMQPQPPVPMPKLSIPAATTSAPASTQGEQQSRVTQVVPPTAAGVRSLPGSTAASLTGSQPIERTPSMSSEPSSSASLGMGGRLSTAPPFGRDGQRKGSRGSRQTRPQVDAKEPADASARSQAQRLQQPRTNWGARPDSRGGKPGGRGPSGFASLPSPAYMSRAAAQMYSAGFQQVPIPQQPIYYSASTPVYYPPAAYGLPTAAPGMTQMLGNSLRLQIEYYFSAENLQKDFFIRSMMDDQGWVLATVVAQFNRVRRLTPDLTVVIGAVTGSSIVETSSDGTYFRAHDNPEQWVLPVERRDPTVQQRKVPVTMFSPSGAAVTALVPQPPRSLPSRTSSGSSRAGFEQGPSGSGSAAGSKQRRRSMDGTASSVPLPPPPPMQRRASIEIDALRKREVRIYGTPVDVLQLGPGNLQLHRFGQTRICSVFARERLACDGLLHACPASSALHWVCRRRMAALRQLLLLLQLLLKRERALVLWLSSRCIDMIGLPASRMLISAPPAASSLGNRCGPSMAIVLPSIWYDNQVSCPTPGLSTSDALSRAGPEQG